LAGRRDIALPGEPVGTQRQRAPDGKRLVYRKVLAGAGLN
jgi:hypothetical protein